MPSSSPDPIASQVRQRILAEHRAHVFVPADFFDLGSREAVDAALGRLVHAGTIRRISRGLYDRPEPTRFGPTTPSPDAVAHAVARSTGESICHDGATAAHLLGATTQVPAQAVYLTDGTNRVLSIDVGGGRGFDLRFRRSTQRAGGDSKAGLTLRALRFLGRDGLDDAVLKRLASALSAADHRALHALRLRAAGWMRPYVDRVLELGPDGAAPKKAS